MEWKDSWSISVITAPSRAVSCSRIKANEGRMWGSCRQHSKISKNHVNSVSQHNSDYQPVLMVSAEDFKNKPTMVLEIVFYTVTRSVACIIFTIRLGSCCLSSMTLLCGCVRSMPSHELCFRSLSCPVIYRQRVPERDPRKPKFLKGYNDKRGSKKWPSNEGR